MNASSETLVSTSRAQAPQQDDPASKLRILHAMRAPVGGLFRHVLDLAGEQARLGHAVGIVVDQSTADELTMTRLNAIAPQLELGVTFVTMSRQPGIGDLSACMAVHKHASALNLNILHGHGAKGGAYARLSAQAQRAIGKNVSSFYTPHGGSLNFKPGTGAAKVICAAEYLLGRITTGLIFESDFARRVFLSRVGNVQRPLRVIPNGLRADDFVAAPRNPDAAEFLFIGELRTIKGVDVLLRALTVLNRTHASRAVIVGSGPDTATLKALADELGIAPQVTFTGAMPARDAFKLGRCLVVPSRAESFPYVVLEAGAANLPIISTNVGGIPEIVAGTTVPLIPADNVDTLVSAMKNILLNPEQAAARAQELKDNVARKFTVEEMTGQIVEFYREAQRS